MSLTSKIAFGIAAVLLIIAQVIWTKTGLWLNINSVLVGVTLLLVVLAVVVDRKLYLDFFTMRTTKHGMNMGAVIVSALTVLVCVNYLANKHNQTWDVTREKLNSLSEQTQKILAGLSQDVDVKVFYKGPSALDDKKRAKTTLDMFHNFSSRVKPIFLNSYIEQAEAVRYLSDQPDRDNSPMIGFVEYNGKKIRVDEGFDESAVTSAIIKATRTGDSKIYFLKGHGEREIDAEGDQGIKEFAKSLTEASFKVESWPLIDKREIPADASLVAIVGPSVPYLEEEMEWLRAYARRGGKLFLALDPGERQNLANLTKTLGIEFENNFIVTLRPIVNGGPVAILGRAFDVDSEITRTIPNGATFAVFPLASEVRVAPDKPTGLTAREIVKSDEFSFTVTDITKPINAKPGAVVSLAAESKGTLPGEGNLPFEAVVFGDSDFISNRALVMGVNRDLGLNAIAQLAHQQDLISIRPKLPKGTSLVLTIIGKWTAVFLALLLPLILLFTSGLLWYRRRGA